MTPSARAMLPLAPARGSSIRAGQLWDGFCDHWSVIFTWDCKELQPWTLFIRESKPGLDNCLQQTDFTWYTSRQLPVGKIINTGCRCTQGLLMQSSAHSGYFFSHMAVHLRGNFGEKLFCRITKFQAFISLWVFFPFSLILGHCYPWDTAQRVESSKRRVYPTHQ